MAVVIAGVASDFPEVVVVEALDVDDWWDRDR